MRLAVSRPTAAAVAATLTTLALAPTALAQAPSVVVEDGVPGGETASLIMSGSVDSQIRGNMLLGNFRNGGSADVQIEKGSIVTFDTNVDSAVFAGKTVKFASTGLANPPSMGVTYSSRFLPAKGSYLELN